MDRLNRRSTLLALLAAPMAGLLPKPAAAKVLNLESKQQLPISQIREILNAPQLHIWHSEGGDVVVAASAEDAVEVFKEATGPWSQGYDKPCPWYPPNREGLAFNPPTSEHDWRPLVSPVRPVIFGTQVRCRHCAAYINRPEDVTGLRPEDWTKWHDDKPFTMGEEINAVDRETRLFDEEDVRNGLFFAGTEPVTLTGLISRTEEYHGDPDPAKRWYRLIIKALPRWWAKDGRRYLASEEV